MRSKSGRSACSRSSARLRRMRGRRSPLPLPASWVDRACRGRARGGRRAATSCRRGAPPSAASPATSARAGRPRAARARAAPRARSRGRGAGSFSSSRATHAARRGSTPREPRRGLVDVAVQQRRGVASSANGARPAEQLVRDHAERVEVGARPDLAVGLRLLGRHVASACRPPCPVAVSFWVACEYALAIPKSAILTAPRLRQQQVLGLEVAVREPVLLRVREPGQHAVEHAEHLHLGRARPTHGRSEPFASSSIAMYGTPSCSKKSNTLTMFGCSSAPREPRLAQEALAHGRRRDGRGPAA